MKSNRAFAVKSKPTRSLLSRLKTGPWGRDRFVDKAKEDYGHNAYSTIRRLVNSGLIKVEVRLTAAGLRALGLKGPTT